MGTFFFDFPSEEEVVALVKLYCAKYGLQEDEEEVAVKLRGWVGREVENACFKAYQYSKPLSEVIANIAPSYVSQKDKLTQLRMSCSGRFISASSRGIYSYREVASLKSGGRAMSI